MIKAGIMGGEELKAGELIRLLINHPDVEIQWINSHIHEGDLVSDIHQGLTGDFYMRFTDEPSLADIDVLFMCTRDGESSSFLEAQEIPENLRIIDLSMDYRLPHPNNSFVYGLPELNRKPMVRGARHVACPGGFATAIELALLPLAKNLLLKGDIHITAITGSTGADAKRSSSTHDYWPNDNVALYRPLQHHHMPEITNTITTVQSGYADTVNFVPMVASFSRGIMVVICMDAPAALSRVQDMYEEYYSDHSFTFVKDTPIDLKDVVNTNKCLIHIDRIGDKMVITSVIDNLLKGASGTAVHCMNLLFGLQERVGLALKASAF